MDLGDLKKKKKGKDLFSLMTDWMKVMRKKMGFRMSPTFLIWATK